MLIHKLFLFSKIIQTSLILEYGTLGLFSKNPESNTKVYSNFDAPNVKKNFKVSNF